MCNCNCFCNRSTIKIDNLDLYTIKRDLEELKKNSIGRKEFVVRNISQIIQLAWEYNKIMTDKPQTAKDARENHELMSSLADQICRYCI